MAPEEIYSQSGKMSVRYLIRSIILLCENFLRLSYWTKKN